MTFCTTCGFNNTGAYCTNCGKTFAIKCCSKCLEVSRGNFCPKDGKPIVSMTHSQYKREKEARNVEKLMAGMVLVSPSPRIVVPSPRIIVHDIFGGFGGGGYGLVPVKKDGTPDRRFKVNK